MTIGEFVGLILQTEEPHVKMWVQDYISAVVLARGAGAWEKFSGLPLTPDSATGLALDLASRITTDLEGSNGEYLVKLGHGKSLLVKIQEKAAQFGIEVDPKAVNAIRPPRG